MTVTIGQPGKRRGGQAAAPGLFDPEALWRMPAMEREEFLVSTLQSLVRQLSAGQTREVDSRASLIDQGFQSLTLLRLFNLVGKTFGVTVPLAALADGGSLTKIANVLDAALARDVAPAPPIAAPAIRMQRSDEPFPLTDVQRAYWIGKLAGLGLGGVGTHFYNEYEQAALDIPRLSSSLRAMIRRHPVLRCVVLPTGQQRILPNVPDYDIDVVDLRPLATAEAARVEEETRRALETRVLPSDQWPLFQVQVVQRSDKSIVRIYIDNLIFDASSYQTFLNEWGALYEKPAAELPALDYEFADYVRAAAEHRSTQAYAASLEFWRARVANMPPPPDLNLIKDPNDVHEQKTTRAEARLSATAWTNFKKLAQANDCTASSALMSAYADILSMWSNAAQFTMSMTVFHRPPWHPQIERILGDFTNIVYVSLRREKGASFAARARSSQQATWECLDHKQVGIADIQRVYREVRGEMAQPVPVVFTSLLGAEWGEPYTSPWLGDVTYNRTQTPQVWIDHVVLESQGELIFFWDYVAELFPPGHVETLFATYARLLESLASPEAWSERRLGHLLPDDEKVRRAAYNDTATICPLDPWLHGPFEKWAETSPERPAVITPSKTFSYGAIEAKANQVASRLRVKPGELVAIFAHKGWEQVVSTLAILKAGAAYLPIDPALPDERLKWILQSGGVRFVLAQERTAPRLAQMPEVETFIVSEETFAGIPAERPPRVGTPGDLAYVIYTSGSTGTPKGVMIEHRAAANTVDAINRRFGVTERDRVLGLSSLWFDLSVYDLFGVLGAGGAVVLPDLEREHDLEHWTDLIVAHRVTIWNSVPALMTLTIESLERRSAEFSADLRAVLLSGDWIPVSLPERIRARARGDVAICSLGGATEASIWSIAFPVDRVSAAWKSIPYGYPLPNQSIEVLDEQGNPRPEGVVGEIHVGGAGLARGYWKDEERTSASFVANPNGEGRLYRTGDFGRFTREGYVEFLGRRDGQVKVRGHRVELGEIESVLLRHPRVAEAVVKAEGTPGAFNALSAFIRPAGDAGGLPDVLLRYLRQCLADHMVPSAVMIVDQFPLSANGKVDRQRLLRVEPEDAVSIRSAPEGPIEEVLVRLLQSIVIGSRFGSDDNLFAGGLDSLSTIRLMDQIREVFEIRLSMSDVVRHPSVARLARLLIEQSASPEECEAVAQVYLRVEAMSAEDVARCLQES